MKTILALACLLAITLAMPSPSDNDAEWNTFKNTYQKHYKTPEEESQRRDIYFENKQKVEAHNARYDQGLVSFTVALNHLADMKAQEVAQKLNGYKSSQKTSNGQIYQPPKGAAPTTVDWRTKGVVTAVKNQGQCGSCWAFSTTGSLEGQHALKKGKLVSLSEQQLVDCSGPEGDQGCDGGLMDNAFNYIKKNGGIDTESSYPYTAEDDDCAFRKKNVAATVTGHVDIPTGSESALQKASANIGPISVAIDASSWSFQLYSGGVYDEPDCSTTELDHGVLVVGYGEHNGTPYWLVKNSWGASWGLDGYLMMSRNKANQCGIATQASYPLV